MSEKNRTAERVRAHVLICMPAYDVESRMRRKLRPMLFDDEEPEAAEAQRTSGVAPARRAGSAENEARTRRTAEGGPVHSFRTLLENLATVCRNTVAP